MQTDYKTGRLWTYVRDDRPAASKILPAVFFRYTPDRKGEHPREHLKNFLGTLQADGYAGFHHLHDSGKIFESAGRISYFVDQPRAGIVPPRSRA